MNRGPRKYTDEQLASALAGSRNMRELLNSLGLVPRGGNYETVRRRMAVLGLDTSHFSRHQKGRSVRDCGDEELIEAVSASRSLRQVLAKLGIRQRGNQGRVKRRIEEMGLDTSHFIGQAWRLGTKTPVVAPRPLLEVLIVGRLTKTSDLKMRLIKEGLKEPRCQMCGRENWNGGPIPLELDHVNGKRDDNRLSNLRIICPNCHAQTLTYRGRNIGGREPLS